VRDGPDWLSFVLAKRDDEFTCTPALLDQTGFLAMVF
jgi:hypothetical protein